MLGYMIIIFLIIYVIVTYINMGKGIEVEGLIVFTAGLRGAGKTYYLTKNAMKFLKKGYPVYTNYPVVGAYKLTFDDLRGKLFPENSVIIYDEAHNELDSDNFKDKSVKESFTMFTQSRKLKYTIFIGSQNPVRVFKGLRDIADYFIWSSRGLLFFNYDVYLSYDEFCHWERENAKYREFKVRKSKKVYNAYDTWFLHSDMSDRYMIKNISWYDGETKQTYLMQKYNQFLQYFISLKEGRN